LMFHPRPRQQPAHAGRSLDTEKTDVVICAVLPAESTRFMMMR